jgi:flagellar hook assembly protein FlgD
LLGKQNRILAIFAVVFLAAVFLVSSCNGEPSQPLVLEITSPQNRAETTDDLVMLSGIVSDPAAVVSVNGQAVEVTEDGSFTTGVNLGYGENTIQVSAEAEGEESVNKTVIVTRILTMEITSPEDKAEFTESPIVISGTVSDPAALVTVNGRDIETAQDGSFAASVELDYVRNVIIVTCAIEGQQPVTKLLTVNRVLTLQLTSPSYYVIINEDAVTVAGLVTPPSAVVTVNGVVVATAKDGSFSTSVELAYGENEIVVNATDPVTRTVTVIRPLRLELSSPEDKAEVTESQVTVGGTVSEPEAVVIVNGQMVEVAEDGSFGASVELDYGENTIEVTAEVEGEDSVGKTITVTRTLAMAITAPEDQAEVTESPLTVSGTISDPEAVVTVSGLVVETAEDGSFSASIELDSGENAIEVTAETEGGESVTKTIKVTYAPSE